MARTRRQSHVGHMGVDPQDFRTGMRRLAAGVSLVASTWNGEPWGLAATAVCSVSASPPMLLACVNRKASAHEAIRSSGFLSVNVLAAADRELAVAFSSGGHPHARFRHGSWSSLSTGAPILTTALVAFDGRIAQVVDAATHAIFVTEVLAIRAGAQSDPLIYADAGYGSVRTLMEIDRADH